MMDREKRKERKRKRGRQEYCGLGLACAPQTTARSSSPQFQRK